MLTQEDLKSNIEGISDENINKIIALNEKDVKTTVSENRGIFWKQIDDDIYKITGVAKRSDEKTWAYMQDTINDLKTKASAAGDTVALNNRITNLNTEIETLKKSGGGDELLKSQISTLEQKMIDKNNEVSTLRTSLEGERDSYKEKYESGSIKNINYRALNEINSHFAKNKMSFDPNVKQITRDKMYDLEMNSFLKEYKAEINSEGEKEVIQLRDVNNHVMINPVTTKPYEVSDLFFKREGVIELLDAGKEGTGAGTAASTITTTTTTLDLGVNPSQTTALKSIRNHIIQNEGIAVTDQKFAVRQGELVKENDILKLPVE